MKLRLLIPTTLLALASIPAWAEPYTLLIYETQTTLGQRNAAGKADAYWSAYDGYAGAMAQAGVLRGGTALSAEGRTTRAPRATSEAAVAVPEISGYFVIEVHNLAEAQGWAAKAPPLVAAVEVLQHRVNPHMSKP